METVSLSSIEETLPEVLAIEQPFLGRWERLVSSTNWEKGRIIHEWREALVAAGASVAEYADETWSRRVGGVTSQHVGRLRRVYQRFDEAREKYAGLYWSHFQAALDWEDAEMWLEGATQNEWSVAQMRHTRIDTLAAVGNLDAAAEAPPAVEVDEDFDAQEESAIRSESEGGTYGDGAPRVEGPDFGDEEDQSISADARDSEAPFGDDGVAPAGPPVRPFENLGELPPDLAEAFDAFKLAILRHKAEGWVQVRCDEVVDCLAALSQLAQTAS